MDKLIELEKRLENKLKDVSKFTLKKFGDGMMINQPSGNDFYYGFWPDDWFFPIYAMPQLLDDKTAQDLFEFLTKYIENLDVVPDRIEPSGHCVFQPGSEEKPHGKLMPVHIPAAWTRVVKYLYGRTGNEELKNRWFNVLKKSYDKVVIKDGLPYVSNTEPQVGFAFFDTIWTGGNDLMCSVVLEKGYREMAELYGGDYGNKCLEIAKGIKENIHKLKTEEGYFISDTEGTKQFISWANGLLLGVDYISKQDKEDIIKKIIKEKDVIIKYGMTRHSNEFFNRMNPVWWGETGIYMDGGFWAVGTGYIFKALYEYDKDLAIDIMNDMIDNLEKCEYAEWVDSSFERFGGRMFMMSLAIPLNAVKAVINNINLIDCF